MMQNLIPQYLEMMS